jgi:hypothetical protein
MSSQLDQPVVEGSRYDGEQFVHLWMVPLATYGVGDIVTTITILWFSEKAQEANVLILAAVDAFGLAGFVGLKLLAFGIGIAVSVVGARSDDPVVYYLPPVVLSVVGTFVTAVNLQLFFA